MAVKESAAGPSGAAPRVSIVTAAFNARTGLEATVESVAGQSYSAREHIVVDGGSTDGTLAYLEGLGDRVRWVSEPDNGIADALNKGVAMATGDYILVLQAEDTFLGPDSLARAADHLRGDPEQGPDLLICGVVFGSGGGERSIPAPRRPERRLLFKPVCHQGVLARRALFGRVGGFDTALRICMDYDFLVRADRARASMAGVPVMLSRMADGGISSRSDWASSAERFAEERRVHFAHCPGPVMWVVYQLYWPAYLGYRRLRALLATPSAFGR